MQRGTFLQRQSHIVSFDDARRSARERRFASDGDGVSPVRRRAVSFSSSRASSRSSARPSQVSRGASSRSSQTSQDEARRSSRTSRDASRRPAPSWYEAPAEPARTRAAQPQEEEFDNEAANAELSQGLFGSLKGKFSSAKRTRAKEKADRRFAAQYGGSESADKAAGPRAAVYKGEMGSQHRKSSRMQNEAGEREGRASGSTSAAKKPRTFSGFKLAGAVAAVCLVFSCAFLYGPAQQLYQETRERDRLAAEYDAIQQRNEAIQGEVDFLSSAGGVEDAAREEFGWVKKGEKAGSVSGVEVVDDSNFTASIVPGSIPAPETWYSGILDPLFGVE